MKIWTIFFIEKQGHLSTETYEMSLKILTDRNYHQLENCHCVCTGQADQDKDELLNIPPPPPHRVIKLLATPSL